MLARSASSLGPIRGLEQSTTARRQTASDDWVAQGTHLPTSLLTSGFVHPGSPSGGLEHACSHTDSRGHLAELGTQDLGDDPLDATRDCYATAVDARSFGGTTDAPDSYETEPASTDAPRAATHAGPARACPEVGDVVRIHGQSASATVISMHPEQCDQVCVRWNTSMWQCRTIDLAEVKSVKPRQPKRACVSATTAETCPTAHGRINLTADNCSTST